MNTRSVAIVVPEFPKGGGVSNVAKFLFDIVSKSGNYKPKIVSLAVSRDDRASIKLVNPKTWKTGVRILKESDGDYKYLHAGTCFVEVEFQRYRPRPKLTKILNQYDLVQVVAGHPAWSLVARNARPPVALQVATLADVERAMKMFQGGGVVGAWRSLMTRTASYMGDRALRQADAVFVENEWMYNYVREEAPPTQTIFAPPGVDTDKFTPSAKPFDERDYILSVGRFGDPRKNVSLLFKAYDQLCKSYSQVPSLVLAGKTAPSVDDWLIAERLGIREHITFEKDVSQKCLLELYREAKLFVLSSDEEGLGLVLMEAMASGVPVVSTDCGGPATVVQDGHTGFLVPKGDSKALAEACRTLLRDSEKLQACGRNARQRMVDHFSEDATGDRFLEVYDELTRDT